ncbi:MAG: CDP-diacylglycerol--serine O-phosphatidyltransferase [Bacteroidetes bacterium]|uniref:CDP-diacylglycerol--serine O-phosphatidyltransferase n=1 Tax=Candidatus Cryptobacteroides faecigallinarum TaxID=2840763 RepID=A0A9D9ILI2_9BACT|nr:CDP-diacylglycerol--serine O-phosphatidyltransferase [Candidatus Cryptobacteroides faecigallinarum]
MKIIRHIPDTITSMNLLCGAVGVICAFEGRLESAFYLMIAAAVFDFLDGFAARALGAHTDIGKELDSLSDMVSFGLLPAIMLHRLMVETGNASAWSYIPLAIAVFSALRLAKFNIDDSQKDNFIGLATPACAMLCGALVHYICKTPDSFLAPWAGTRLFIPVLSLILCALLVSRIPMFSLKFKAGQKDSIVYKLRIGFIGFCVAVTIAIFLFGLQFSMIFIVAVTGYIIMNISNFISTLTARK